MKSNTKLIIIYTAIEGLIAAIGSPIPGTSLLVFFLGILANLYFSK